MAHTFKRILVVDDEPGMRLTLGELLRDEQFEVDCVGEVREARELMDKAPYDIVISDIILPRESGLELLDWLHAHFPKSKVVLITGQPTIQSARQAVRLGAFDYLTKPITLDDLLKVIHAARHVLHLEHEHGRLEDENRDYRKQLESLLDQRTQALLESEKRYLDLFRDMPHGLLMMGVERDQRGELRLKVQEANAAFETISGHMRDELVGSYLSELLPRCDAETKGWSPYFFTVAESGKALAFLHDCKRLESRFHVAVYRPNPERLIAIFDDITAVQGKEPG